MRSQESELDQLINIDLGLFLFPLNCIHETLLPLRWTKRSLSGAWKFIAVFTRPHLEPGVSSAHIATQFILGSLLILSSHLRQSFPNRFFPLGCRTKNLYPLMSPCLCTFHFPVTSSLLGRNIFLSTLPSNSFSVDFSLAWEAVSHTHKTASRTVVFRRVRKIAKSDY
jgi:hypothetical protein